MREFELTIDEALRNGLSPFKATPFNSPYLNEFLGWRLGKAGPEKYETKDNPIVLGTLVYSWPFPQYVTGERYNFLIIRDNITDHADKVYEVSDNHATINHVFDIDVLTFGSYGTLMEVADFGEYAIMMNGVAMIYWNVLGAWNASVETATVPLMRTICNFKGQVVGGGVTTTWHDCDETFYCWSKIGEVDFTPNNENTAGYRRDPYGGNVKHVRRLRDRVVGYSDKGIVFLVPTVDPVPTFGFVELSDVGIKNQGAMDGDLNQQVYVGEDNILRRVTEKGIEELGYERWMEELDGEDIIVSYDKKYKDFYIGNSTKTFLLSPNGLSEVPQHPSAVWRNDNETFMLPGTVDSYYQTITSWPYDVGYAGQKTVVGVETDLFLGYLPEAAISYYTNIHTYGTTNYKPLNNQNICAITAVGNAFAVHLRCNPLYDNSTIGYIKVRYKMNDLRGIRGVYAPPPRGQ